ncbi:MAG: hypothetical protein RL198_171 [Actinomycetota bacterium]
MAIHHWVAGSAVALSLAIVGVDTVATATTKQKGQLKATYQFLGRETEIQEYTTMYYECDGELQAGAPAFNEWITSRGPYNLENWSWVSNDFRNYLYAYCEGEVQYLPGSPYLPEQADVWQYMNLRFNVSIRNLARGWSEEACPDDAVQATEYDQNSTRPGGYIGGLGGLPGYMPEDLGYSWTTWDVKYFISSSIYGPYVDKREKPVAEFSRMICGPDASTPSGIGVQVISTTLTLPEIGRWPR